MEKPLTLVGHLHELRKRIIVSLLALACAIVLSLPFASRLLRILKYPLSGSVEKLVFFSPQEGFVIYMRLSFLSGLILALPVILFELWAFVSPAIPVESRLKKKGGLFILFSLLAFASGCLFAYFLLVPSALKFLLGFCAGELEPVISADKYISFILSLILACGLVFEMPVLSFLLSRLKLINARMLRNKYKYAAVIIFIAAAVITPTSDVFNMMVMAAPMFLLYEISIWVTKFARPR